MKKHLLYLLALLCVSFACGCSDEDEKAPDSVFIYSTSTPADNPVSAEAGVQSVTIFTTCAWKATSQADWITVSPASGAEKGIHVVHLNYTANTSDRQSPETENETEPRSGTVIFQAGSYTETFTLTQKGSEKEK